MNIDYTPRERNEKIANFITKSIDRIRTSDYYIENIFEASELTEVLKEDLPSDNDNEGRSSLIKDICEISSNFFNQTKSKNIRIQLQVVTDNKCRLFHADNNSQRLLCTFHGPGTQWLDESNINREWLGHGDNDKIVKDFTKVRNAKEFDILLLKGDKYSSKINGAVHRSPSIETAIEKRVLLKIDEC